MPLLTDEQLAVATPEELDAYAKALEVELALLSPLDYAEYVSSATERYAHVELLNRLIVALVEGRLRHPVTGQVVTRLAVSMPPRHGKSYLISEHTPPWFLSKYGHMGARVAVCSYEADFAATWGRKGRNHIERNPEFGIRVDPSSKAANRWDLIPKDKGAVGGMVTAGVGGPLTGKGAHLLIIDDPLKNDVEAQSETIRENHKDWWGTTSATRLEPNIRDTYKPTEDDPEPPVTCVLLVMTRWHEDDLAGYVTTQAPDSWYVLNLPALAGEDADPETEPTGRGPGEALCPQRYDQSTLEAIRADPTTGGRYFAALYQGRPNIEGGGIFKQASFRYFRSHEEAVELLLPGGAGEFVKRDALSRFTVADLAATAKTTSDFSVVTTWDVTRDRRLILVDRIRRRLESADHDDMLKDVWRDLKPGWIGVEETVYHLALITRLQRDGVPVRPLKPDKDKIARAIPAGNIIDAGRVYFPQEAPWLDEWEHELLAFHHGTYDDQVDNMSYAALVVTTGALSVPLKDKAHPEDRSAEARVQRLQARLDQRKGTVRHPQLGRIR